MSSFTLQGRALVDGEIRDDQVLVCEQGAITYVGPKRADDHADVVVESGYIVPGYVDIHVHGAKGHDVMDGTLDAVRGMAQGLAMYGVTSFLATTLTASIEDLLRVVATCRAFADAKESGAELVGVHLEGPWINLRYKGAQNEAHVVTPQLEDAKALLQAAGDMVKVVTLAPEHAESYPVMEYLRDQGIRVSVGHSDATYDDVKHALAHGLSHVTHCYNAMRSFHHREPGVVGAAMHHDELTTELIADGVHVHPVAMSILYRLKQSERLVLVSDGMRAVGMEDGQYDLGGLQVEMKNGEARLADGTLAGSTLTLERAVQNMVSLCGLSVAEAVTIASATPARIIGMDDRKGHLRTGYDADFLILDQQLNVQATYRGGACLYSREG